MDCWSSPTSREGWGAQVQGLDSTAVASAQLEVEQRAMGCAITVVVFGKKPWITASSTVVCDACVVDVDSSLLNLASGQVAVLNCLGKVVLKGRFAEVCYVVGRD